MRATALFLALACLAAPATAQSVSDCDYRAHLDAVPQPWQDHVFSFSNGAVTLAVTDTIEPGAGPFHVVLVSPPYDELGGRQCRVVSYDGAMGFAGISPDWLQSDYDPSVGLYFFVPIRAFDPGTGGFFDAQLGMMLNQATGAVDAWINEGD